MLRRSLWCHATVSATDVAAAYKILGLQPGATPDAVRQRYLSLARLNHPDLQGGDDSKMKIVNLAYETVQTSGHLLNVSTTEPPSVEVEPNEFKRKWKMRAPPSTAKDHRGWKERSHYDWAAAISVTADERMDPLNHPNTFNPFFSFDDDATIYQQIRNGATIAEAARTVGKPELALIKRLDSAQFKARIQKMLTKHGHAKAPYRETASASKRVTRAQAGEDDPSSCWDCSETFTSPRKVVSSESRRYPHLMRFAKKR